MTPNYVGIAIAAMALILLAVRIFVWQWRPDKRPCKWFGHDKKYVAIKVSGCVPLNSPESSGRPFPCDHKHQIGEQGIYIARWVCRRCPAMVEECLGRGQDWTIEHGKLVPDVKKWANWSQDPPAARAKLEEIQKRISQPTKEETLVHSCNSCGRDHKGRCHPENLP